MYTLLLKGLFSFTPLSTLSKEESPLEERPLGARTRTNNKRNPHMTPGPGEWNPRHIGGRRALSPLRHPCFLSPPPPKKYLKWGEGAGMAQWRSHPTSCPPFFPHPVHFPTPFAWVSHNLPPPPPPPLVTSPKGSDIECH